MTTTVVDPPADHSESDRPIFLTINCSGKAGYLVSDNKLNEAVYRQSVIRISSTIQPEYLYPSREPSNDFIVQVGDANQTMPVPEVRRRIAMDGWLECTARDILLRQFENYMGTIEQVVLNRTTAVLFDEALNEDGSTLLNILRVYFYRAQWFAINNNGKDLPYQVPQVFPAPLCKECSTRMRPAGTCFVCEGCGSTQLPGKNSKVNEPLNCTHCFKPMQKIGDDLYRCPTSTRVAGADGIAVPDKNAQGDFICPECGHAPMTYLTGGPLSTSVYGCSACGHRETI